MALGDHYFERIKASNDTYMVSPYAVEPKLDIAALGAVDGSSVSSMSAVPSRIFVGRRTGPGVNR